MRYLCLWWAWCCLWNSLPAQPLPVVIAGVSHGHAAWAFEAHKQGQHIRIVAIQDADPALAHRWASKYGIPATAVFTDLTDAIQRTQPRGVLAYGALEEHLPVVRVASQFKLPVMVEKPLAHTLADAREIARLSRSTGTPVLVNYESSWYPALAAALQHAQDSLGTLRKILVNDGHWGPVELGAGREFLAWLTDSTRGGGALIDFGCYGANIATAALGQTKPLSVTAITARNKPSVYPRCEDEATIVVQYPGAQAILQASWNWPYHRKDATFTGTDGVASQWTPTSVETRPFNSTARSRQVPAATYQDSFHYFADYVRNTGTARTAQPYAELAGLENNLRVMQILELARMSARQGRTLPFSLVD